MKIFPTIYPITDTAISGLSHLEQARQLIEGGARIIQIRDKTAASNELFEEVRSVVGLATPSGITVIVNDRADIAFAAGASGVHLGQHDLPPDKAREFLGPEAVIGFSTHSVDQAVNALRMPVDYIAIGPVFPTSTKEDPDPVVGLSGIVSVREAIGEMPLVAIGGITFENFRDVLNAGADSVALIGGVLACEDSIKESIAKFLG